MHNNNKAETHCFIMIINLIAGPRNVSTALMYSFAQRSDTSVIDEPFYGYYLSITGIIHPGREMIINSMSNYIKEVTDSILNQNKASHIIFLKNMAHHHINVDLHFLESVKNVFLIRNPAKLLVSFSKVIDDPTIDDIGVKKSWEIYHELKNRNETPLVIDSGELLKDPHYMLKKLCHSIGITYKSSMQKWPAGPRKEDGVWAGYWYHNLHKSTHFIKSKPKKVQVPGRLQNVFDEAKTYYKELFEVSIKCD